MAGQRGLRTPQEDRLVALPERQNWGKNKGAKHRKTEYVPKNIFLMIEVAKKEKNVFRGKNEPPGKIYHT